MKTFTEWRRKSGPVTPGEAVRYAKYMAWTLEQRLVALEAQAERSAVTISGEPTGERACNTASMEPDYTRNLEWDYKRDIALGMADAGREAAEAAKPEPRYELVRHLEQAVSVRDRKSSSGDRIVVKFFGATAGRRAEEYAQYLNLEADLEAAEAEVMAPADGPTYRPTWMWRAMYTDEAYPAPKPKRRPGTGRSQPGKVACPHDHINWDDCPVCGH